MNDLYTITQVGEHVYNITENITDRPIKFAQQLVVGEDKAALIDASFGIDTDLIKIIRQVTTKPIICLLTHGDPDHTGGASLFESVYMNPTDDEIMKAAFAPAERLHDVDIASGHNQALVTHMKEKMPTAAFFNYQPLQDGDRFDLGGITLQAVALPGHSKGSMCFVDAANHYGFTGDSLATAVMSELYDTRCASLTAWENAIHQLKAIVGDQAQLFSGHRADAFPAGSLTMLEKGIAEIKAGKTAADQPLTKMPTGAVKDTETMHPRAHRSENSPFIIMYNELNVD
ncbi:MBL fold metallo-hydrolase [Loigolactobacillus iwatensis]|uniref:MBL fold metallo-hydrolase n=1 Tax=Loigolactobacillus iwatensis TaxID=1267156 RepID=UPI000F7F6EFD|nr:MBL fold metallo-hydrolase [Loigolactobacillus iwatensis]